MGELLEKEVVFCKVPRKTRHHEIVDNFGTDWPISLPFWP